MSTGVNLNALEEYAKSLKIHIPYGFDPTNYDHVMGVLQQIEKSLRQRDANFQIVVAYLKNQLAIGALSGTDDPEDPGTDLTTLIGQMQDDILALHNKMKGL